MLVDIVVVIHSVYSTFLQLLLTASANKFLDDTFFGVQAICVCNADD